MLDLDQKRRERAEQRRAEAAQREGRGETLVIQFGGEQIAVLGPELPLDVLEPLRVVSADIALLIRWALQIAEQGATEDAQRHGVSLFVDLLSSNQNLPNDVLDVISGIATRLLGEDGFAAFVAQRPSREDCIALARGVIDWYGVSLGESLRSTVSSESDGPTSKVTSLSTSEDATETPGDSGPPLPLTGS